MANLLSTTVNGNLITSGGYTTSNYTRILYPSGGSYVTTTSVITGAIRIKLPTQGSAMMMTCTVKVYEYSTNKSFTITFGGHRDSNNWYNEFCYLDGDSARGNLTVRFGVDDGKDCVWIGDTSTQWSYPQVFVTDVQLGYTGYNQAWASGWSVSFVTSFATVNRTQTAYAKITNANIGSQSVNYATSAGNSNTTSQIVFNDLKTNFPSGAGGGHSFASNHYSMGLDSGNGGWSDPHYRDVIIGYHTGIRIGAAYSGIRFYNNSPTTDANNDGNGDGGETLLMTIGGYVGTASGTDVVVNNNLFANVSMRAPIFYDSDDTTYYLDPNSTGTSFRGRGEILLGPNTSGEYTRLGGNGGSIDYATMSSSNGNLHIDCKSNYGLYLNYYARDTIYLGRTGTITNDGTYYSGTAASAGSSTTAAYLPTLYNGSVQSNPQTYFGQSAGLRVAMTGHWSVWSDTLWINGYSGGDVLQMCALHTLRNGQPRMAISAQASNGSSYGSIYEFWSSYNMDAPNKSGTSYYQTNNWMQFNGGYGLYWPSQYGAHFYPNDGSTYTQFRMNGSKNGYDGVYLTDSRVNGMMYDGEGNGGVYREANALWYFYYHLGNNCMGIGTSSTSSSYKLYVNGTIYATGDVIAYSDSRKKTNIVTIDNALNKVLSMRGVFYNKLDEPQNGRQVGVIAQEVNEVLPEAVNYASDVDEYGVKYGNIVGVLIEAIKEQQAQIDELKAKLDGLTN